MALRDSLPTTVLLLRPTADGGAEYASVPLAGVTHAELLRLADEQDAIYARFRPCSEHGDGKLCAERASARGDLRNCQPRPMWHWYRAAALRMQAGLVRPLAA